jgi:hypothetical protein
VSLAVSAAPACPPRIGADLAGAAGENYPWGSRGKSA